jgi:hypothetical protein
MYKALAVMLLMLISGCTMTHTYTRDSNHEYVLINSDKNKFSSYYNDAPVSEYSGFTDVKIEDGKVKFKLISYGLFEEYKAPYVQKKLITHYGPHKYKTIFVLGSILTGGLNFLANPKIWSENLSGWDEEFDESPTLDKSNGEKTGNKEWRKIDSTKNIIIDWGDDKNRSTIYVYKDGLDFDYDLSKLVLNSDKKKIFKINVICENCNNDNILPQLEKLYAHMDVEKDLSSLKNQLLIKQKLEYEEKAKKEKEAQQLAKIQKEQNDPLTPAKKQCQELGFKDGTEKFGNCVLQLSSNVFAKQEVSTNNAGDGTRDDQTCQKYGFRPGASNYSDCRMKIDMAKQQAAQQQAQYEQQQRQYQTELAEYNKRKEKEAGLKLMQFGLGVLAGGNGSRGSSGGYGAPPVAPSIVPSTQTYVLPGGQHMNCTTTGNVTNCF